MKSRVPKPELKLGAEPKKVAWLGGLLVVLIVVWLMNRGDNTAGPGATGSGRATTSSPEVPGGVRPPVRPVVRGSGPRSSSGRGLTIQEFHPTLKPKEPIDTTKVDPTLQLDLLAKLRNAKLEGGSRSLFDFSAAPPPETQVASVAPIIPKPLQGALTTGPKRPADPAKPAPPPPPPAIPLKFYGYTNTQKQQGQGPRRAFFLEGEDIFVAGEGDVIKNRYKIIRIGVNSAVVEDTQFKNQQTLPLVEEMANS